MVPFLLQLLFLTVNNCGLLSAGFTVGIRTTWNHNNINNSSDNNSSSRSNLSNRSLSAISTGLPVNYNHSDYLQQWDYFNVQGLQQLNRTKSQRQRRSISHERHIEVFVVADTQMANYHGENLRHYILTLMSTVASIYRDESIGNAINIAVVKLEVMNDDEEKLLTDKSAQKRLRHFCKWQRSRNIDDDKDPMHHDVAILLTREDLCRKPETCDTLGLAQAGKICDSHSSCAVIEDNGLAAAFTIAHELGHVLNIPHDDDEKCARFNEEGQRHHIMARMLDSNSHPWSWSVCSKHFITEFLDAGEGDCLLDRAAQNFLEEPVIPPFNTVYTEFRQPGELYDMDYQCELVFGPTSKICPYMPACKRLWCTIGNDGGCRTQHMPWADGTPCDRNKWCLRGECVPIEHSLPPPVDGKWGPWSPYTSCTRSCGGGIQKSVRECNQPKPAQNGRYCTGRRVRYRSCNTHECPPGTADFREEQCTSFDGQTFNIQGLTSAVKWVPHYSGIVSSDMCKLYCRVQGSGAYYLLKQKVIDGTPCGPESYNVCVNGHCLPAGCDHKLDSKTQPDSCGVCGGNNSTCKRIENRYYEPQVNYGYNAVTLIPAGATNLEIVQFSNTPEDQNYLVLRDHEGNYLLNGDFVVNMFRQRIEYGGTTIDYSGSSQSIERINSTKPLFKPLYLEILSVGQLSSPEVKYSYVVSLKTHLYEWKLSDQWSHCNKVCNGEQELIPKCVYRNSNQTVDDAYCNSVSKPAKVVQVCNLHCQLKWRIMEEMECSSNCGSGMKRRLIRCVQELISPWPSTRSNRYHELSDRYCERENRPEDYVSCNGSCNGIYWKYSEWSECSKTCGQGIQTRSAWCLNSDNKEESEELCEKKLGRKVVTQSCELDECPEWKTSEWSSCSSNCGPGKRQRSSRCQKNGRVVNEKYCNLATKPDIIESCNDKACRGDWTSGDWSPCIRCANESQRQVVCRSYSGERLDDNECRLDEKPLTIKPCFPAADCKKIQDLSFNGRARGVWRTGMWSACSSSCGFGSRKRYVACVVGETKASDNDCDAELRPASEEQCEIVCNDVLPVETRFHWRTGPWGNCSGDCNSGIKRRLVLCYHDHQQLSEHFCKFMEKPDESESCEVDQCNGQWQQTAWEECSKPCGSGVQSRRVWCADSRGKTISDYECSKKLRPESEQKCNQHECPEVRSYKWYIGPWTKCFAPGCSKNGTRRRLVLCINDKEEKSDAKYCSTQVPYGEEKCEATPKCTSSSSYPSSSSSSYSSSTTTSATTTSVAPRKHLIQHASSSSDVTSMATAPQGTWVFSDWSQCSASCGNGTQTRQPICVGHLAKRVAPCNEKEKPRPEVKSCFKRCSLFQWRKSKWSGCSKSCGSGHRTRAIHCVDWTNTVVPQHFCEPSSKPATVKACYRGVCPFIWQTTQWSPCSTTCGLGYETRVVTCHRVNRQGIIDPVPVTKRRRLYDGRYSNETDCDLRTKPASKKVCNYGSCYGRGVWVPQPWEQCSAPCGTGYQRRKVPCLSPQGGGKVPRHYCDKKLRPRRKIKCFVKPCSQVNCAEFLKRNRPVGIGKHRMSKSSSSSERDRLLMLYCSGMLSRNSRFYSSGHTAN